MVMVKYFPSPKKRKENKRKGIGITYKVPEIGGKMGKVPERGGYYMRKSP